MSILNQQSSTDTDISQLQLLGLVDLLQTTLALSDIEGTEDPLAEDADMVLVFAGLYALNKTLCRWLSTESLEESREPAQLPHGHLLR